MQSSQYIDCPRSQSVARPRKPCFPFCVTSSGSQEAGSTAAGCSSSTDGPCLSPEASIIGDPLLSTVSIYWTFSSSTGHFGKCPWHFAFSKGKILCFFLFLYSSMYFSSQKQRPFFTGLEEFSLQRLFAVLPLRGSSKQCQLGHVAFWMQDLNSVQTSDAMSG